MNSLAESDFFGLSAGQEFVSYHARVSNQSNREILKKTTQNEKIKTRRHYRENTQELVNLHKVVTFIQYDSYCKGKEISGFELSGN